MNAEAMVFSLCLSIIVCDSVTVYLSSMMTSNPCKVHASSTGKKKKMDKYTENRLKQEIILYLKYLNVIYCNPYKEESSQSYYSYTSMCDFLSWYTTRKITRRCQN